MIRRIFIAYRAGDDDAATGTYADGLFPLLAAQELSSRDERTFRASYARDCSTVGKTDLPAVGLT